VTAFPRDIIHADEQYAPPPLSATVNKLTVIECELCNSAGGHLLWRDDIARVVLVADDDYPGFFRVILNRHAKEMTDLAEPESNGLMRIVFAVESAVRDLAVPDKINLASLGNAVPHLHWHVIPRWTDDVHFPKPVWATAERACAPRNVADPDRYSMRLRELLGP
jgi:diadenosine tetraphosphate (Ap4A) HIT family hydrolase